MKLISSFLSLLMAASLFMVSCQKDSTGGILFFPKKNFFKSSDEATRVVGQLLDKSQPGETLESIQSISYMSSLKKNYAFVFYKSSKGEGNIMVQKEEEEGVEDGFKWTGYRCLSDYCDCRIRAVVGAGGTVAFECTCTSCEMIVNSLN